MLDQNIFLFRESDRSLFVVFGSNRNQTNRFLTKLDRELSTWLQFQHGGVGLADEKVTVPLNFSGVAQLTATLANSSTTTSRQAYAFGFQKSFIESGEI